VIAADGPAPRSNSTQTALASVHVCARHRYAADMSVLPTARLEREHSRLEAQFCYPQVAFIELCHVTVGSARPYPAHQILSRSGK
jgi:hypothetical protein